jgi:glycosyltransferase involved in cell wall biosynthesis
MSGINSTTPLVNVIINCYNGEKYLRIAIESVFVQTYSNWRIIFWDNQSTDDSAGIAKSYGEKIEYYRAKIKTNLGEARNLALKEVKGDYITFIDCDDVWLPSKLQEQVDLMEEQKDLALCYAGIEEILPDGAHFRNVPAIYKTGYILKELLLQYDVNILTSMIRTSSLNEAKLSFDKNITASEEYCLFMQLACKYRIGVNGNILAQYRVHETSLTSKSLEVLGNERRYTLNKIIHNYPGIRKKFIKEFREAFARADYYDSRWHMHNYDHLNAFCLLIRNSNVKYHYFFLAILSIFPTRVWENVHLKFRNRV